LYTFLSSSMLSTCPAHLILLDLICLMILQDKYNYDAPHSANSSILLLLNAFWVHIFSSEPYSQTLSVYALPVMWETKFHTHTRQLANYG
jgi:hypothetical protein